MIDHGLVSSVTETSTGTRMIQFHGALTSTLYVEDAAEFNEKGGQLVVQHVDYLTGEPVTMTYTYTAVDYDNDVITLSNDSYGMLYTDYDEGTPVWLFPISKEKAATVVLGDEGESITARVPHSLAHLLAEGVRSPDAREAVAVDLVEDEWVIVDVLGKQPISNGVMQLTAASYEDETETILASINENGDGSFADLEWSGTARGDSTSIELTDLEGTLGSVLGSVSRGVLFWGSRDPETTGIQGERGLLQLNTQFSGPRQILFLVKAGFNSSGTGGGEMNTVHRIRYQYDANAVPVDPGNAATVVEEWYYPLHRNQRRATPTFVGIMNVSAGFYNFRYSVEATNFATGDTLSCTEPVGVWILDAGVIGDAENMAQKPGNLGASLYTGGADNGTSPTPQKKTYTKTYSATWSRGYDGSGAQISAGSDHKVGRYSATNGNTKAAIGFDDAQIRKDLTGVANGDITKVELYVYFNHWYFNSGGTAVIGTHNDSTAQSTWAALAGKTTDRKRSPNWPKPGGRWVDISGLSPNDWRDGNVRGVLLGPGPNDALSYYGHFNGASQANKPKLRITYKK